MNVIITGAGKGIGLETAKMLASDNRIQKVIGISRDVKELIKISQDLPALIPLPCDLEKDDIRSGIVPAILTHTGEINLFIHNAGLLFRKNYSEIEIEEYDRMFQVHVRAFFMMVKYLSGHFSRGSHIVAISSMSGYQGSQKFNGLSAYGASKAALAGLAECLSVEMADKGVSVNCLAPGSVSTEMFREAFPGATAALSPKEMAAFIVQFAIEGHHYFNGKVLPVSTSTP